MPAVGPALPSARAEKRKRDESEDSDSERPSSPDSAGKRPRVIGPSMPPAPLDERLPESASNSDDKNNTEDESSEDDDFGPALPTAADSARRSTVQQAAKSALPASATLQRDEWMTMAPAHGDWSARVDPTQLKARKFNTGKGAKAPPPASGASDAWHETPEQKQARLQRELMGIKDKSSASPAPRKPARNAEDAATAQRLKDHSAVRGPSLYNAHQKKEGRKEEEDDPSKRAFDREKDIAGGLQLNSTQRRDMMKKASDFGTRFSSAKYLILEYALIPGCLMTLVEGQTLRNIKSTVPKRDWLYVVTQATLAISEIGDYEVLNNDTRIDNIIIQKLPRSTFASSLAPSVEKIVNSNDGEASIQPTALPTYNDTSGSEYTYGIILSDFAHSRLRRPDESLLEWCENKFRADEEGLIGCIMHGLCGMAPFPRLDPGTRRYFVPRPSGRLVPEDEIENRLIRDERAGGGVVVQTKAVDDPTLA